SISVTVNILTGAVGTITGGTLAQVIDAPLVAGDFTPPDVLVGDQISDAVLFHFTDANPLATVSEFVARVQWGDHNLFNVSNAPLSSVSIVANPAGGFDVLGTHTYTTGLTNQTFRVTVTDSGGATVSASTNTFGVDYALQPYALETPAVTVEGQSIHS